MLSICAFLARTTRTAVYVHPLRWSLEHLDILRVSNNNLPIPCSAIGPPMPPMPAAVLHPPIKTALRRSLHPISTFPPFNDISCLLTETIYYLQKFSHPHYANLGAHLPLTVAGNVVHLEPFTYHSRTNRGLITVPFLAYNDPAHRHAKLEALKKKRWPDPYKNERSQVEDLPVDPHNVAILIAMAQAQAAVLGDTMSLFTVCQYPTQSVVSTNHIN